MAIVGGSHNVQERMIHLCSLLPGRHWFFYLQSSHTHALLSKHAIHATIKIKKKSSSFSLASSQDSLVPCGGWPFYTCSCTLQGLPRESNFILSRFLDWDKFLLFVRSCTALCTSCTEPENTHPDRSQLVEAIPFRNKLLMRSLKPRAPQENRVTHR